jgi:hypothetical protein
VESQAAAGTLCTSKAIGSHLYCYQRELALRGLPYSSDVKKQLYRRLGVDSSRRFYTRGPQQIDILST